MRQARAAADPQRQCDYVLGALVALPEWHFLNVGTSENPRPAAGEIDDAPHLFVFSDAARVMELAQQFGRPAESSAITIPTESALAWCVNERPMQCAGLLINPGEDAAAVSIAQVEIFAAEWRARDARQSVGFWIPNPTSAEEDFWRENGL
jgi:hypothetical protein